MTDLSRLHLTRSICSVLKEHIEQVQENIAQSEQDKVSLETQDKERVDQYQVITGGWSMLVSGVVAATVAVCVNITGIVGTVQKVGLGEDKGN